MAMLCCERCQFFWSCERKWYRGERGEENVCCDRCDFYKQCLKENKQSKRPSLKDKKT